MPAQQRRRRHDERLPTRARQQSAGDGEQHAVDGGDRRSPRLPAKNREFVPQDDDFEFLELLRPDAQGHEFKKPAKQPVTQRHEHEASYVRRLRTQFYAQDRSISFDCAGSKTGIRICAPFRS
jgi:hypothetical protein